MHIKKLKPRLKLCAYGPKSSNFSDRVHFELNILNFIKNFGKVCDQQILLKIKLKAKLTSIIY